MANILLVSDGVFHPPWQAVRQLKEMLSSIRDIELTHIRSLNDLENLDTSGYQAMVLYYHQKQIGRDALGVFEKFVNDGGGVLAIHSATASFKDSPRYFEILGGRFSHHGPVVSFDIDPLPTGEAVFTDVGSFTVHDELYLHDLQPGNQVHFTAIYDGEQQPMIWTRTVGHGRVCYFVPGHCTQTMKNPQMQELLVRGLAWVMDGGS